MQIIHWGRARRFWQTHRRAVALLKAWKIAVKAADWKNFTDVRRTFSSADWVEGKIVFNMAGNDYRLIAIAQFSADKLHIRHVLTHEDYDLGAWKK